MSKTANMRYKFALQQNRVVYKVKLVTVRVECKKAFYFCYVIHNFQHTAYRLKQIGGQEFQEQFSQYMCCSLRAV